MKLTNEQAKQIGEQLSVIVGSVVRRTVAEDQIACGRAAEEATREMHYREALALPSPTETKAASHGNAYSDIHICKVFENRLARLLQDSNAPAAPPPHPATQGGAGRNLLRECIDLYYGTPGPWSEASYEGMARALRAYHTRLEHARIIETISGRRPNESEPEYLRRVLAAVGKDLLGGKS
jgi:hypothetical protein